MRCCIRRTTAAKHVLILVMVLCLSFSIFVTSLAWQVLRFDGILKAHTISEADLSFEYQVALNASLKTVPCCEAARWTPSASEKRQEMIPRIIHQTYKTANIPQGDWQDAHQLCLNLHPPADHWTHMFWTDETAHEFIRSKYPDFLETYDAYIYPIQRVDAMRYLILYTYGGIYIDLDIGCARSMESLLKFPAFFPRTTPTGISNDLIGSRKNHPFMFRLISELQSQGGRRKFLTKYITVFFTTGPMFVNRILSSYWLDTKMKIDVQDKVMILPPNFYSESFSAYFMHFPGSSWHGDDAHLALALYHFAWVIPCILMLAYLLARPKHSWIVCSRMWIGQNAKYQQELQTKVVEDRHDV